MSEQTANLCTTDACESLRARLAKYEDAEGRPVVVGDQGELILSLTELADVRFDHDHRLLLRAAHALESQAREIKLVRDALDELLLRVRPSDVCEACHGQGYFFTCEDISTNKTTRAIKTSCPKCSGELATALPVREAVAEAKPEWAKCKPDWLIVYLREVARLNSSHVSLTQCDGCRAGIPLENGMHAMGIPGGYADKMMCTASHYESAPSHGEQVRAGWQWVPVDPTPEMLAAVTTSKHEALRAEVMRMAATDYRLMLAAAPSAVSQEQGE